jgi:catechol-2,3-dioxygenase
MTIVSTTLQQFTPARLHHLGVVSEHPERLAQFYRSILELGDIESSDGNVVLAGPDRAVEISDAKLGRQPYSGYAVHDHEALESLKSRLIGAGLECVDADSALYEQGAFLIEDPQGRRLAFGVACGGGAMHTTRRGAMPARLQHTVFQTTDLKTVVTFYTDVVGFAISDEVVDETGRPMVVFMRSDDEHHSLAFFQGSENVWDHHCYETSGWNDIRDWGDRFAKVEVPIFFGPGRHGPGNNLFFMVTDPDGNRLEFSAELQRVALGEAPGVWPHGERTLNSWGRAWIRS